MAVVLIFMLGIANFALHKAVLESRHPMLMRAPWLFRPIGGRFSLMLEFLVLLGAMVLADGGATGWGWSYGLYSLLNALSAWMILSGRV